ncbi:MAG TPA: hypothetical protein VIT45_12435 [Allosphingosinicella sp.]
MPTDGQRKLLAYLLASLGLFLFAAVKFAPLPHRATPASVFLLTAGGLLLFAAAGLCPRRDPEDDEPGLLESWMQGRIVLMFAATLFLLAYGLWAMFTGPL